MKKATIHEIARSLNIDSSTVSRALNDSPLVKKATKDLILKKAREMGYKRNLLASNLRRNKSNTIGVIVPRISRHFFSSTIAGIEEAAYKDGFNVIICQSLEQLNREQRIVENLLQNRVDGILISVSMETLKGSHLEQCAVTDTPLVFFDRHIKDLPYSGQVLIDDFHGGFVATEHLILKGCKKIAHFTGPKNLEIYKNRLAGYRSAMEEHDLENNGNLILPSSLMESDGFKLVAKLLDTVGDVDGIFCANDLVAIGAMKGLKALGKTIPDDIAIVGFSNEPISEIIEPSLTTIDQNGESIGRLACEMLLRQITRTDKMIRNKTVVLTPKLIERESSNRR
ncbi:LacI family transcriptional regulator [Flavobacteriaceae bacterium F89]|uniref:LacI family transcriptional regulator n=1 Tax=Cerina litoralis TaxID=2874477 RepID=A0AAE3EUA5_9FLAO|nr:LacI family DNA-binding transcriptional regulator [Cerina litoralis]MCG2460254.1 LacI family transcriptional regulator [Cerina litoralis]